MELFFGSDRGATAELQHRRERGLLDAAALGEIHLHVATLAGDVLALGAFQRGLEGEQAGSGRAEIWRRRTGGRAIAAGDGFAVVTLALPHRSALIGDGTTRLRPEQVMNRAVRGLLASLREYGFDPVYPGLDFVTVERRSLAHLSFVERDDGATLFQAVLALTEPLSRVNERLDRLDPCGIVPMTLLPPQSCTTLAACSPGSFSDLETLDPAALVRTLASGYERAFGLSRCELDPEVVALLGEPSDASDEDAGAPSASAAPSSELSSPSRPSAETSLATVYGRLGPVQAWLESTGDRVIDAGVCGDFIAPISLPQRLRESLLTARATRPDITAAVAHVIDGDAGYLLGLDAAQVADLLLDAGSFA